MPCVTWTEPASARSASEWRFRASDVVAGADVVVVEDATLEVDETEDSLREGRPREGDSPGPVLVTGQDLSLVLLDARLVDPEAKARA